MNYKYIATISLTDLKIDFGVAIQYKSIFNDGTEEIESGHCGTKIEFYDTHSIQCTKEQLTLLRDFCNQVLERVGDDEKK